MTATRQQLKQLKAYEAAYSMAKANLKKVNTSQLLLPQHQSTYPRGSESASIVIPPFRPHLIKFSKTVFY